jgi:hypothetical protein
MISDAMSTEGCEAMTDPLDHLRRLEINAKEWLAALSFQQLLAVAGALQDTLLERRCSAAAVLSQGGRLNARRRRRLFVPYRRSCV